VELAHGAAAMLAALRAQLVADGRALAYVRQEHPPYGDADSVRIEVLDVATGTARRLTGRSTFERIPVFSPDGSRIAYWYPRDGDPRNVNEIHVAPASGGHGRSVTAPIDRNLMRGDWLPSGDALLVGGNDSTTISLWVQPLDGRARRLDLGDVVPNSGFWVDLDVGVGGAIAFVGSASDRPSELYFMTGPDAAPERLTDFNGALAAREYGRTERFDWQGPDGFRQDGVLHFPPGYDSAARYPLVLVVHGGPRSASRTGYGFLPHLMAARGWIVFEPNYRGSDNRGNAFQRAIFNDAGEGPGRDVMSGVAALKKRGIVDQSRVAVSGWSYGGYMTTWLLGHYSGWKAAVAGAAVTDWMDQYNLADFNVRARFSFGGSPWTEGRERGYRDQSPITYANRIRTPTLILSNTGDARVPITQSYKLYHALRDNGVTTQFIAYPIPGHFPDDPVRIRDVYRRWIEWLDRYLQPGAGPRNVTAASSRP
jgi:dipeptidyl aminopeptidase/acylaminoacyl peptidase